MKHATWYKNKKTGNRYKFLGYAIDCTNRRDGTEVVIYQSQGNSPATYVRETAEFLTKFEPVV